MQQEKRRVVKRGRSPGVDVAARRDVPLLGAFCIHPPLEGPREGKKKIRARKRHGRRGSAKAHDRAAAGDCKQKHADLQRF